MNVRLEYECQLVDQPPGLCVDGIEPGHNVVVSAECIDSSSGLAYSSWAEFKAPASGMLRPTRQRPLAGTYKAADPFGLWWSMESTPKQPFSRNLSPVTTRISAEVAGHPIAQMEFARPRIALGVRSLPIRSGGLVATLFLPDAMDPAAGLIVAGGSEGGIGLAEELSALLASHGFAALALAYFGLPGLPQQLVRIPLEYVEAAAESLLRRPEVAGSGVGILGVSRGGELALLLASVFPRVRAVVGYAASSVVWPGFTATQEMPPAWTRGGMDLSFAVPRPRLPAADAAGPLASRSWFASALRERRANSALIPLERTKASFLLVSGGDDRVWPAQALARIAMRRLSGRCLHLNYASAGHGVGRAPGLPAAATVRNGAMGLQYALGGSRQGNAFSARDAWPRVLAFLRAHLAGARAAPRRLDVAS
jgi:dienelactone hydrolase